MSRGIAAGWPIAPRFSDVRGAITEIAMGLVNAEDQDWFWDEIGLFVASPEDLLYLVYRPSGLDFFAEGPDNSDLPSVTRQFVEGVSSLLNVSPNRSGGRAAYFLPCETKEEATEAIERGLLVSGFRDLASPFGGHPYSIQLNLDLGDPEVTSTNVKVSALGLDEAEDESTIFSDSEEVDFPPAFVEIVLDREHERAFDSLAGAVENAEQQLEMVVESGRKFALGMREAAGGA